MECINLLCLPFAGGSRYSYRMFEMISSPLLNIIPLEYPGRGARMKEPLIGDFEPLVADMYNYLKNNSRLTEGNYAIYGHSMGALLGFLLTRKIVESDLPPPRHLFVSGTTAPSSGSRNERHWHQLPRERFIEQLRELDGSPAEVLENRELFEFLEPIIRSDFKVVETYRYSKAAPLDVPITVITGTEEDMEEEEVQAWQLESRYPTAFIKMPGKHFFIFSHAAKIINIISEKILSDYKTKIL